jgi:hypothetical protein
MSEPDNDSALPEDSGDEIVVTDQDLFEDATDKESEPVPERAAPPEREEPAAPPPSRARDDQGRFVAQQQRQAQPPQLPPQPQAPPPMAPPRPQPAPPPQAHTVPIQTLLDERERRQRAEMQYAQMQAMLQQQQRQQPPQDPNELFSQPQQYLQQNVMQPLMQMLQRGRMEERENWSRAQATQQFGKKMVDDALAKMAEVRMTPEGDWAYQQIMASPHPYEALVSWHRRDRALSAIGNDPDAWLRNQQQAWVRDPNAQRAVFEHVRQLQAQQRQGGQAPPAPVNLPPSLSSVPQAASRDDDVGELTTDSLYRFATR